MPVIQVEQLGKSYHQKLRGWVWMERFFDFGHDLPTVGRFGLATRGNTHLKAADVRYAVERGINYLNWRGYADGMSKAIAGMGAEREHVVVAWQMEAATADAATENPTTPCARGEAMTWTL